MATAALIISVLAVVVAVWAAVSSHRSADAAREAVKLEHERRHAELAPEVEAEYAGILVKSGGAELRGVVLHVHGVHAYSDVQVELLPSSVGTREAATRLISLEASREVGRKVSLGPFQHGDKIYVGLDLYRREDGAVVGGQVRMRLVFRDEEAREWTRNLEVDVPGSGQAFVPQGRIQR